MKIKFVAALASALLCGGFTQSVQAHSGKMEACMKAALALHPGKVISLEAEVEKGKPIYEFDIQGADGKEWEVECDAKTGKVTEVEEEVASANDPAFKAKITLEEAQAIALKAKPGKIVETEFSIEGDGQSSYEFDIVGEDGVEWEIEIDAMTGKIIEMERETYQIGLD